ncbi:MAG: tRNA (guanosine(46)-N7)-methyltransferase TrmB [Panacagrimonas sp.]
MKPIETIAETCLHRRPIRSFVRREGRMTSGQKDALERLGPRYSLDPIKGLIYFEAEFGRNAPVGLEIGFGNGDALIARAQQHPDHDYLGAEVHRPGVGYLLLQVEQLGLGNVRTTCRDAVEVLRQHVAPGSLSEIVIEFPDPWHKTRHHKRRLIQPAFAKLVCERLAPGGLLRLATDWAPYAQHMLEVLNAEPALENLSPDGRFVPRLPSRPRTRFERRGERLGHEVFDLAYRRR